MICNCNTKNKLNFFKNIRHRKSITRISKKTKKVYMCKCGTYYSPEIKKKLFYYQTLQYRQEVDVKYSLIKNQEYKKYYDTSLLENFNHYKNFDNFYFKNKRVLDFGCGTGSLLKLIESQAAYVAGVELNKFFIKLNKIIGNKYNIYSSLNKLNKNKKKFDTILCFSCLEQIRNIKKTIKDFESSLLRGGYLILGCLNANDYRLKSKKYLSVFFRDNYVNYFSKKGIISIVENISTLKFIEAKFLERYDYFNYLKFFTKKNKNLNINNYKKIIERKESSDYMYIIFQKN